MWTVECTSAENPQLGVKCLCADLNDAFRGAARLLATGNVAGKPRIYFDKRQSPNWTKAMRVSARAPRWCI